MSALGACLVWGGGRGVSAPGRCLLWDVCLVPEGGVPGPGGGGGGIPACTEADPPHSVNRMTDSCKNITLPQTSFAGGKYYR